MNKFSKWKGKEDDNVYLNRLLKNATLVLPAVKPTPRSPELQKRIEILKASQQNLEYKQMVSNLSQPSVKPRSSSAVVSGLNFSVTVFASVFGCIFLLRNIIPDILVRCIIGLVCGILLLCIEIFLAVRAVNKEETKSKAN
ncbi:unnamed protein product [Clavelina lepadiformis]|uniref:Transmembrane protein 199 n=1 Tax=Clavelina lepadiformis TaxID=159417 RepID=A0ABP0GWK7_CLALP